LSVVLSQSLGAPHEVGCSEKCTVLGVVALRVGIPPQSIGSGALSSIRLTPSDADRTQFTLSSHAGNLARPPLINIRRAGAVLMDDFGDAAVGFSVESIHMDDLVRRSTRGQDFPRNRG
jgi:hypothetical protein